MGSSTIFRGTVVESTLIPDIKTLKRPDGTEIQVRGNGTYKVRFSVSETFSGEAKTEQIVYTAEQSSACGFLFQVGREYLAFTYLDKAELWTSHCSRTTLLEPGVENAAITWMRAYGNAPHGSEISGSLLAPRDNASTVVPATIQLSGPESRTAWTDADGKYVLRNLRPGEYSIAARVPDGFATGPPRKITITDKSCTEMMWQVTFEGRIRGKVVDGDHLPVADLHLELEYARGASTDSVHRATTDLNGSYEFEHLSPNEYFVVVRNAGFLTEDSATSIYYPHSQRPEARSIALGPTAKVDGVDFVLARLKSTPSIGIKVVLLDGSPAPAGLTLFAFPNGPIGRKPTRTGMTNNAGVAFLPLFFGQEYGISVALDRQHPGCGFAALKFSEDKQDGTIVIDHPEACIKEEELPSKPN